MKMVQASIKVGWSYKQKKIIKKTIKKL
jgi:hypothetical protein